MDTVGDRAKHSTNVVAAPAPVLSQWWAEALVNFGGVWPIGDQRALDRTRRIQSSSTSDAH